MGYDGAERAGTWNGYTTYKTISKELLTVGYPLLILEKDGRFRMQTSEECAEMMFGGKE